MLSPDERTARLVESAHTIISEIVRRDLTGSETIAALCELAESSDYDVFASFASKANPLTSSKTEEYGLAEEVVIAA